ncbi:MAG TPA: hypothetical protein VGL62_03810 [Vicinamibacterales bacterium]|jgi:hypothetical protein
MHHYRFVRTLLAAAALAALAGSAAAQQQSADPWYGRMAKPKDFDPPKVFANTFSIELPKDWQLAPGHTGTVFLVAEKTKRFEAGAVITLEYMRLQAPFDPSLLNALAPIELDDVRRRELAGQTFTLDHKMVGGRALIVIQYDRPGLAGAPDHVVQYSFPIGQTMYRLICIAPTAEIQKYRPIFAHAAASFTPLKGAGG